MRGLLAHLATSLRLHFRNRLALVYGYLFPLIFLVAFGVLYRHEAVPLLRHVGELLTISVLGGACFGLPTTMVSERERGVWRRYQLFPLPVWTLVAGTAVARYVILLTAAMLQIGVALAAGMTVPAHPLDLLLAFTLASFAFIGLGLVIAMLADSVPAVQALGQCIFLPMLVIGGVAVPLGSLPEWARHVAAFLPGRYAVDVQQACVTGDGLASARFAMLALVLIGTAGIVTAVKLFRWDTGGKRVIRTGKAWVGIALGAWLAVGLLWEGKEAGVVFRPTTKTASPAVAVAPVVPAPPWAGITEDVVARLDFQMSTDDDGVVAPFAGPEDRPDARIMAELHAIEPLLATWPPGNENDPVQNVRNFLAVAALVDFLQMPIERQLPPLILQHLSTRYPRWQLVQVLTWIVLHPDEGSLLEDASGLGIDDQVYEPVIIRERAQIYALKFIIRLTGRLSTH